MESEIFENRLFSLIFRLDKSAFLEYFNNNAMRRASTLSFQESNHCSAAGGFYPEIESVTPAGTSGKAPAFHESDHYSEFSPEPAIEYLNSPKRRSKKLLRLDWNNTGSDSAFTRRWMHPDHLGTASLISSDAGDAESITIYLPYGAVLEEKSETGFRDPYGFTGKELEVDLGIMYFGARWYNPQLGRWLSPDPLYLVSTAKNAERQQNLYEYASNNPWKFVDPNGLKDEKIQEKDKVLILTGTDEYKGQVVELKKNGVLKENITVIDRRDYTYDKKGQEDYNKKVDEQLKKHNYLLILGHGHRTIQKLKRFVTDDKRNIVFDTDYFYKNTKTYNNMKFVLSNACVQADNKSRYKSIFPNSNLFLWKSAGSEDKYQHTFMIRLSNIYRKHRTFSQRVVKIIEFLRNNSKMLDLDTKYRNSKKRPWYIMPVAMIAASIWGSDRKVFIRYGSDEGTHHYSKIAKFIKLHDADPAVKLQKFLNHIKNKIDSKSSK